MLVNVDRAVDGVLVVQELHPAGQVKILVLAGRRLVIKYFLVEFNILEGDSKPLQHRSLVPPFILQQLLQILLVLLGQLRQRQGVHAYGLLQGKAAAQNIEIL